MNSNLSISVVIPSYNRTEELKELLDSILLQDIFPQEVIVCEDNSPEMDTITQIISNYHERFLSNNIKLVYIQNEQNLGYDKNLRKCIESSNCEWAMVMGNDDLLLPRAIKTAKEFIQKNNTINFISRTFIRFNTSIKNPLGISRISKHDEIFTTINSKSNIVFRTAGFVGGLIVNVPFARKNSTEQYDGSLYYQIYLAAMAYCEDGIGYISEPIVGGRADNPPMFGNSHDDKELHVPGSYTAKGRAAMWRGVLQIADSVGKKYNRDLSSSLKRELMVRQSFHVFEMNAGQSYEVNCALKNELNQLGLMSHFIPLMFFSINCIFQRRARGIYKLARAILQ
ncbi:N-glycosyltransferase [Pragia fontium]|uniref:glycosyltransferase family 2 protein n=1 Tax=Pragia fontium TaxID=82985 RepID=UPI000DFA1FA3|nr:glycosyltransferase family 2 protein [Pragia fontium]SUB83275.1 N-glycosyltransferase [Pragia fontium]